MVISLDQEISSTGIYIEITNLSQTSMVCFDAIMAMKEHYLNPRITQFGYNQYDNQNWNNATGGWTTWSFFPATSASTNSYPWFKMFSSSFSTSSSHCPTIYNTWNSNYAGAIYISAQFSEPVLMTSIFVQFGDNQNTPPAGHTWGTFIHYVSWNGTAWWYNPADYQDTLQLFSNPLVYFYKLPAPRIVRGAYTWHFTPFQMCSYQFFGYYYC